MWLLSRMNHLVELQGVGVRKCFVAHIALVGTLIGVNPVGEFY